MGRRSDAKSVVRSGVTSVAGSSRSWGSSEPVVLRHWVHWHVAFFFFFLLVYPLWGWRGEGDGLGSGWRSGGGCGAGAASEDLWGRECGIGKRV